MTSRPIAAYGVEYRGGTISSAAGEAQTQRPGTEQPVYYWDPVIAPGGMDVYAGSLFPDWQGDILIGGLQAEGLVRVKLDGDRVVGEERVLPGLGRARDVEELPDGSLLVLMDEGTIQRVTPG